MNIKWRVKEDHAIRMGTNPKRCRCYLTTVYGETRKDDKFVDKSVIRKGYNRIVDASAASSSKRADAKEQTADIDSDGKRRRKA